MKNKKSLVAIIVLFFVLLTGVQTHAASIETHPLYKDPYDNVISAEYAQSLKIKGKQAINYTDDSNNNRSVSTPNYWKINFTNNPVQMGTEFRVEVSDVMEYNGESIDAVFIVKPLKKGLLNGYNKQRSFIALTPVNDSFASFKERALFSIDMGVEIIEYSCVIKFYDKDGKPKKVRYAPTFSKLDKKTNVKILTESIQEIYAVSPKKDKTTKMSYQEKGAYTEFENNSTYENTITPMQSSMTIVTNEIDEFEYIVSGGPESTGWTSKTEGTYGTWFLLNSIVPFAYPAPTVSEEVVEYNTIKENTKMTQQIQQYLPYPVTEMDYKYSVPKLVEWKFNNKVHPYDYDYGPITIKDESGKNVTELFDIENDKTSEPTITLKFMTDTDYDQKKLDLLGKKYTIEREFCLSDKEIDENKLSDLGDGKSNYVYTETDINTKVLYPDDVSRTRDMEFKNTLKEAVNFTSTVNYSHLDSSNNKELKKDTFDMLLTQPLPEVESNTIPYYYGPADKPTGNAKYTVDNHELMYQSSSIEYGYDKELTQKKMEKYFDPQVTNVYELYYIKTNVDNLKYDMEIVNTSDNDKVVSKRTATIAKKGELATSSLLVETNQLTKTENKLLLNIYESGTRKQLGQLEYTAIVAKSESIETHPLYKNPYEDPMSIGYDSLYANTDTNSEIIQLGPPSLAINNTDSGFISTPVQSGSHIKQKVTNVTKVNGEWIDAIFTFTILKTNLNDNYLHTTIRLWGTRKLGSANIFTTTLGSEVEEYELKIEFVNKAGARRKIMLNPTFGEINNQGKIKVPTKDIKEIYAVSPLQNEDTKMIYREVGDYTEFSNPVGSNGLPEHYFNSKIEESITIITGGIDTFEYIGGKGPNPSTDIVGNYKINWLQGPIARQAFPAPRIESETKEYNTIDKNTKMSQEFKQFLPMYTQGMDFKDSVPEKIEWKFAENEHPYNYKYGPIKIVDETGKDVTNYFDIKDDSTSEPTIVLNMKTTGDKYDTKKIELLGQDYTISREFSFSEEEVDESKLQDMGNGKKNYAVTSTDINTKVFYYTKVNNEEFKGTLKNAVNFGSTVSYNHSVRSNNTLLKKEEVEGLITKPIPEVDTNAIPYYYLASTSNLPTGTVKYTNESYSLLYNAVSINYGFNDDLSVRNKEEEINQYTDNINQSVYWQSSSSGNKYEIRVINSSNNNELLGKVETASSKYGQIAEEKFVIDTKTLVGGENKLLFKIYLGATQVGEMQYNIMKKQQIKLGFFNGIKLDNPLDFPENIPTVIDGEIGKEFKLDVPNSIGELTFKGIKTDQKDQTIQGTKDPKNNEIVNITGEITADLNEISFIYGLNEVASEWYSVIDDGVSPVTVTSPKVIDINTNIRQQVIKETVEPDTDFSKLLKKYNYEFEGYQLNKNYTVLDKNNNVLIIQDNKVPKEDFKVLIHYNPTVQLTVPKTVSYGNNHLAKNTYKKRLENKSEDSQKIQVIDTFEDNNNKPSWSLSAQATNLKNPTTGKEIYNIYDFVNREAKGTIISPNEAVNLMSGQNDFKYDLDLKKRNHYSEEEGDTFLYTFKGISNLDFAKMTVSPKNGEAVIEIMDKNMPHSYFSNYASIIILDKTGAVKYEKVFNGMESYKKAIEKVSIVEGDAIYVTHKEPKGRLIIENVDTGKELVKDKNNIHQITKTGILNIFESTLPIDTTEEIGKDFKITSKGYDNQTYSEMSISLADMQATIHTLPVTPHGIFSGKVYSSIIIRNSRGIEKYKKEYIGDAKQKEVEENITLEVGDYITIHHMEGSPNGKRLMVDNLTTGTTLKKDKDISYIITNQGLEVIEPNEKFKTEKDEGLYLIPLDNVRESGISTYKGNMVFTLDRVY